MGNFCAVFICELFVRAVSRLSIDAQSGETMASLNHVGISVTCFMYINAQRVKAQETNNLGQDVQIIKLARGGEYGWGCLQLLKGV